MNDDYGPAPKKEVAIAMVSIPLEKLIKLIKKLWRWK